MGRSSLQNVLALPDAAQTWNFDLIFPNIPGGGDNVKLTYKCQSSEIPQSTIEALEINLHGVSKREAGRATYMHTFNASFLETVDWATYMAFRKWRDSARSWKNNSGTDSSQYKVNLEMDMYDNQPKTAMTIKPLGCFPTEIAAVNLNGSEGAAIFLTVTFSFDSIDDGVTL